MSIPVAGCDCNECTAARTHDIDISEDEFWDAARRSGTGPAEDQPCAELILGQEHANWANAYINGTISWEQLLEWVNAKEKERQSNVQQYIGAKVPGNFEKTTEDFLRSTLSAGRALRINPGVFFSDKGI